MYKIILILLSSILFLSSCTKDIEPPTNVSPVYTQIGWGYSVGITENGKLEYRSTNLKSVYSVKIPVQERTYTYHQFSWEYVDTILYFL
jgi:hypothetical protein